MITFKHILEAQKPVSRETVLSTKSKKVIEYIEKNCTTFLSNKYIEPFYRGRSHSGNVVTVVDPSKFKRRGTGKNQFGMMMNIMPSWKKFPDRFYSLIGTTSYSVAKMYASENDDYDEKLGEVLRMIPFDGAKIAVCGTRDFWNSAFAGASSVVLKILQAFFDIKEKMHTATKDCTLTEEELSSMLHAVNGNKVLQYLDDNSINNADKAYVQYLISRRDDYIVSAMLKNPSLSLFDVFNKTMAPEYSQMQFLQYSNCINLPSSTEIWTASKCLLIENGYYLVNIEPHLTFAK